jgi:hypothetical protein
VEGDPQKIWDKIKELNEWKKVFAFVLSSHAIEIPERPDVSAPGGMYQKNRTMYLKTLYRGKMLRMMFTAQISGSDPIPMPGAPATGGAGGLPSKSPSATSGAYPPAMSMFRGGAIMMKGPMDSISGTPFVDLSEFLTISLNMMQTQMMIKGRPVRAGMVTMNVDIDYQKLFIADKDVSLFRLDYRSSEFDQQVQLGLQKFAEDFKSCLKE